MDIIITFVVGLGLLVLLVFILHKHQLSQAQSNANKILPLPPLDSTLEKKSSSLLDNDSEKTLPPHLVRNDGPSEIKYKHQGSEQATDPANDHWLAKVSQLKKTNSFTLALAVCESAYPRWSAYQQAVLVHRARIKELHKLDQPIENELHALYKLTALAEFLHGRVKGLPDLSLAQLKLIDPKVLQNLDMPYDSIGYLELRLIKKTDIRLILSKWGKPESHQSPRQYHSSAWLRLAASQATLF